MPMLVEMRWFPAYRFCAQRFQDGLGKPACGGGICNSGHQNGELVAAQPRHHLALAEHRGDARATVCSTVSPAAWPNRSLTSLNRSRSRQSTARLSPSAQGGDFLVDPRVEMAAVGQRRSARRDARDSGYAARPPCAPADREPRRRDAAVRQTRSAAGSIRPSVIEPSRWRKPVSTGWFEPDSSLARAAWSGKQLSSLAPTRLEADKPVRAAKLVLTETIVSPSQTSSPSTEALARSRMRSTSSSERRRSRISSTAPASASPIMTKLAIATPIASHPAGSADCETVMVGSGMIATAPIAVK